MSHLGEERGDDLSYRGLALSRAVAFGCHKKNGAVSQYHHRVGLFGCNRASRRCVAEWTRRDSGHGVLLLERLWLNAQQWTDWMVLGH